jgi:hypothetical protein
MHNLFSFSHLLSRLTCQLEDAAELLNEHDQMGCFNVKIVDFE